MQFIWFLILCWTIIFLDASIENVHRLSPVLSGHLVAHCNQETTAYVVVLQRASARFSVAGTKVILLFYHW
jgi:hypothetical protein